MYRNLTGDEGLSEDEVANAQSWISLNLNEVLDAEEAESLRLAKEFEEKFPDTEETTTAREAVKLKIDLMAPKEDRDLALAWGSREENREKFHITYGQVNKELLHNDLVAGSNIKGALDEIKVWHGR